MVTILGFLVFPLSLFWISNPVRLIQLAMVTSIFQAGSALVIGGGFGLPVAMVPGQMFILYVIIQYALGMRFGAEAVVLRAVTPLIALVAYAALSIMFLPDAFAGMIMVFPQRPDPLDFGMTPLVFTFGNVTQILYLVMNVTTTVVVAIFLTRTAIPYTSIIRWYLLGGYLVVGLAFWQFVSRTTGLPFIPDVLYSNPSFAIVDQAMGSVPRIQGPFSEPAALASYLSGLCFCCLWLTAHGYRMMRVSLLLGLSILTMLLSTSTTGIVTLTVGLPLILMFAAARADRRALVRLGQTTVALGLAGLILIGPVFVLKPALLNAVSEVIDSTLTKGESDSYNDRTGADFAAMQTIPQTYGLGVGWGSFRSSSLLPGMLANGGLFGVAMMVWLGLRVCRLSSQARANARGHPGQGVIDGFSAALCGSLAAALVSAPTIDSVAFFLQLGCVIGTCARMSIEQRPVSRPVRRTVAASVSEIGPYSEPLSPTPWSTLPRTGHRARA